MVERPHARMALWLVLAVPIVTLLTDAYLIELPDMVPTAVGVSAVVILASEVDRRRVERRLRQREKRVRQALESARTIAWEMNPLTGDVIRTGSLADWLGLPPDKSLNSMSEALDWVHPDDRARVEAETRTSGQFNRDLVTEYRMCRADGGILWVMTRCRVEIENGIAMRISGVDMDITDRKRNEERLRLLESVVVHARDAVVILEASPQAAPGRSVLYVNEAFSRMTGYSREEVVGRSLHFLRGPESDTETLDQIRQALDTGTSLLVELQNYRKDGTAFWVELSLVPVPNPVGQLAHWVMIQRDVSDRKRAEEAIRESERAFRRMADTAPAMLWVTDENGSTTFLSRGWYEFTGQHENQGLGFGFANVVHPEDQSRVIEHLLRALTEREPFASEYRVQRAGGRGYSWVFDTGRPWFDHEGTFLGYIGSVFDIDARKGAEESLRRSEERYRLLFESNPQPLLVYDRETRAMLDANAAAVRKYGYSREELLRLAITDLHYISDTPIQALSPPTDGARLVRHRTRDGRRLDVECTTFPLSLDRRPVELMMANDVTQRLLLEEQLRHAQKMEAVGELAGGIAHDFNNLLTGIQGNLALVHLPDNDPNRPLLATVEKAAHRAADLTGKLLGYARRSQLRPAPISLREVVEEVLQLLRRTLDPRIAIQVNLDKIDQAVRGDAGLLHQAILNLCLNARDAMPQGGTLTISGEIASIGPEYRPGIALDRVKPFARLSFHDTGHGIPPDVLPRIFEPCFTTKESGRGTGLGLPMVHGIVEQHGGWVEVRTEVGRWTCFDLYLPTTESPAAEVETPALHPLSRTPAPRAQATILFVDDEEMIRQIGRTVLEAAGYTVLEATDGHTAVKLFRDRHQEIDLVILDQTMPGLSGRDAAKRMAEIAPLRFLISTGYSADDIFNEATEIPILAKPYRPADLRLAVKQALFN